MAAVLRLGLTGGIGSGKSTVLQMLARRGAAVIDADAISRGVTAPAGAAIASITAQFGPGVIAPDGGLDRQRMRELAYADPQARQRLESIIHPLVGQESQRQEHAAVAAGKRCIVFDVPLLVESGRWRQKVDKVIVVDCSAETQITRVMARSALTREAVQQIMDAQASRARRLSAADVVLCNEGPLERLESDVNEAADRFGL